MPSEGFGYLVNKALEAGRKLPPECKVHAIPENRAFESAKWNSSLSIEEAKEILDEEYYWQKEENRERYPGFKWF